MDVFDNLLLKAMQLSDPDEIQHNRKRHYKYSHQANEVVTRTIVQNPHMSRNLHAFQCPHCLKNNTNSGGGRWIVGHKPISA